MLECIFLLAMPKAVEKHMLYYVEIVKSRMALDKCQKMWLDQSKSVILSAEDKLHLNLTTGYSFVQVLAITDTGTS